MPWTKRMATKKKKKKDYYLMRRDCQRLMYIPRDMLNCCTAGEGKGAAHEKELGASRLAFSGDPGGNVVRRRVGMTTFGNQPAK